MAGPACAAATNGGCKWQWRRHAQPARLAAAAASYLLSCILTRAACCLPKSDGNGCSVDRCDLLGKHCCTGRCSLPAGCRSCTSRRCESMLLGADAARATQGDPTIATGKHLPAAGRGSIATSKQWLAGLPTSTALNASQHPSYVSLNFNHSLGLQAGGPPTSSSFNSRQLETEHAWRPVLGKKGRRGGPVGSTRCRGVGVLATSGWAQAGQFRFKEGEGQLAGRFSLSGGCHAR